MSEVFTIILTSVITIFGGVIIFCLTQIILKFVIDPIHMLKTTIGEVADGLIFYADIYGNPMASDDFEGMNDQSKKEVFRKLEKTREQLRQLATLLQSRTYLIPCYSFFEQLGVVTKRSAVNDASLQLLWISNSLIVPDSNVMIDEINAILERRDKISKLLNLKLK